MTRRVAGRHVVGAVVAALFVLPLLLLVAGSLREVGPASPARELLPARPTLGNFARAAAVADLPRQALNSAIVAAVAVPLAIVVAAGAGLAMARLPARPRRLLIGVSLAAGMIPLSMLVVGRFSLFRALGTTDTFVPLIATGLIGGSPFNVLLFYLSFRRIPADLWDAATLDGATAVRLLLSVGLPLARGVTVAVAVLAFAASWGNVIEPLVYLSDEALFTLPLGLRSLAALDIARQPIMLAGAVMATAIPVLVLLAAQRWIRDEPPSPL